MEASGPGSAHLRRYEAARDILRGAEPRATLARETQRILRAEVVGSTALAGSELSAAEVDALLDRGIARGDHRLADYVLVRDYADAARWVANLRPPAPGDPRPLLTVDELRQLNARAVAGPGGRGGAWRLGNPAPRARIVAPAAWLVPREVAALVDRFARGPGVEPVALWLARFMGRLGRIRPFDSANGRTARLAVNVLLRRLDIQPLVLERPERRRYASALAAAEADEPLALAQLVARALLRAYDRLRAAAGPDAAAPLLPLRALAGDTYAALAKAAQRGRLRTILRGGRYFSTQLWVDEYRRGARARFVNVPSGTPGATSSERGVHEHKENGHARGAQGPR
ncbi:MAG: Fic family protein [Candidatus Velthaea sp.]